MFKDPWNPKKSVYLINWLDKDMIEVLIQDRYER